MADKERLTLKVERDLAETEHFLAETFEFLHHPRKEKQAMQKAEEMDKMVEKLIREEEESHG